MMLSKYSFSLAVFLSLFLAVSALAQTQRFTDANAEYAFDVPEATLQAIRDCKARGGRVVAVGTTSVRALESRAKFGPACKDTNIFITPGFEFQVVDLLLTNFHLPKSTLMMLVSALAGYEHIMALYRHAIDQRYRFFSYGDAMLLQCRSGNK